MTSKKTIDVGKYNTESREEEITKVLESIPDMDREEIGLLATNLNIAAATGKHVPTSAESTSLKTLSQKYIKDAPKDINIKAEVKTEQVIMAWLEKNDQLEVLAERRAISQAPLQDAHYELLDGFAKEIRGDVEYKNLKSTEVIISDGDEDEC